MKNMGTFRVIRILLIVLFVFGYLIPLRAAENQSVSGSGGATDPAATPKFRVEAVLSDEDNQFTPADEADLKITIENIFPRDIRDIVIQVKIDPEKVQATEEQVFDNVPQVAEGTKKNIRDIMWWEPGLLLKKAHKDRWVGDPNEYFSEKSFRKKELKKKRPFSIDLSLWAGPEDNAWIFHKIIKGNSSRKTTKIKLIDYLSIRIVDEQGGSILFEQPVPIRMGDQEAALEFPSFAAVREKVPDQEHIEYYTKGDPLQNLKSPWDLFLAIRAARYSKYLFSDPDRGMLPKKAFQKDLLIPETQAEVVGNVAQFVYDSFFPKNWPEPIEPPSFHSQNIALNRIYGPGKAMDPPPKISRQQKTKETKETKETKGKDKSGFACIEHAFMMNNLLRILGFPVREINSLLFPILLSSKVLGIPVAPFRESKVDEGIFFQDAASEVFYYQPDLGKYDWKFFSLYNFSGHPITNPVERYGGYFSVFELWAGVKDYQSRGSEMDNRFVMSSDDMAESDIWQYRAYGVKGLLGSDKLTYTDSNPYWSKLFSSYLILRFFSPVAASVTLSDGRKIGSSSTVEVTPEITSAFLMAAKSDAANRLITPFEGAYYYPEGLPIYNLSKAEVTKMKQTLVVPIDGKTDPDQIKVQLVGTGDGEYTMESIKVEPDTITYYEPVKESVKKGEHYAYTVSQMTTAFTFNIPTGTLFEGAPISLVRSSEEQQIEMLIRRPGGDLDEKGSVELKVDSLPAFISNFRWSNGATLHFAPNEKEKTAQAFVTVPPEGKAENGKLTLLAASAGADGEPLPVVYQVWVKEASTAAKGRQEGRLVAMPLRADAPADFPRENAIDFVDYAQKEMTVHDRLAVFYTPSSVEVSDDGKKGFMWEIAVQGKDGHVTYGYELAADNWGLGTTYRPAKTGSPGKFVAIVELSWPLAYELRTCPVRVEDIGLLGSSQISILPDKEKCKIEGAFALTKPLLVFKDFIIEPFSSRPLPEGEYLGESNVSLKKTGDGPKVSLSIAANWMRTQGSKKTPAGVKNFTSVTADFTFPETLDPAKQDMGEGFIKVSEPDDFDLNNRNASTPYSDYLHGFLAIRFLVGELQATPQPPPDRNMFKGMTMKQVSRGWGGPTEKWLGPKNNNGERIIPFRQPEHKQTLTRHLSNRETLFVVPVRVEIYELIHFNNQEAVKFELWGYAVYGSQPGKYTGPMPTGQNTFTDSGSRPEKIKPIKKAPSDDMKQPEEAEVTPEDTSKNIDPKDPKAGGLIKDWIKNAKPLANAKGADLRFDKWGRVTGRAVGGIITLTGSPDDVAGRSPEQYVWDNRAIMDSINLCKLEEYVVAQIRGEDISHCRDRNKEVAKSIAPELTGLTAQEAKAVSEKAGLIPEFEVGEETHDPKKEGVVYRQIPPPSTPLQPGSRITLLVHTLAARPAVPNVIGIGPRAASEALNKEGLTPVFEVGEETRDSKKDGIIYYQTPAPGSTVKAGSNVVMKLYSFAEVALKVPHLTGLSLLDAKRDIEKIGLKIAVNLQGAAPSRSDEGKVSKQNPEPGRDIKDGAVVEVWVYGEYEEVVQPVKKTVPPEETATEYCALGKSSFNYQQDVDYYVFRKREPRRASNRWYSREYSFLPDYVKNIEATVQQIKQEGKLELVFKGRLPGLCPHLRENCALSTMNHADKSFFGDICGKWEDPPPVYISKKPATIPDLRGMSVVNAQKAIEGLGMNISVEVGDAAAKLNDVNLVYKQTPGSGTGVTRGGGVTVWIYGEVIQTASSSSDTTGGVPFIVIPDIPENKEQIWARLEQYGKGEQVTYGQRYQRPANGFLGKNGWRQFWIRYSSGVEIGMAWQEDTDNDASFPKSSFLIYKDSICNSSAKEGPVYTPGKKFQIDYGNGHTSDEYSIAAVANSSISRRARVLFSHGGGFGPGGWMFEKYQREFFNLAEYMLALIEPYAKPCDGSEGSIKERSSSPAASRPSGNAYNGGSGGGTGLGGCGGLFGADACK